MISIGNKREVLIQHANGGCWKRVYANMWAMGLFRAFRQALGGLHYVKSGLRDQLAQITCPIVLIKFLICK